MRVADFCRRDVVVIDHQKTLLEAAVAMRECHSGDVVVVRQEGTKVLPIGIVSDHDVVVEAVAEAVNPQSLKVKDLLVKPLLSVHEDQDLRQCMKVMKLNRLRRLLVVDDDETLVGIISVHDVMEALTTELNDFAMLFNAPPVKQHEGGCA